MYGIFTYIYHKKSTIHVGKYTFRPIHPIGWDIATDKVNGWNSSPSRMVVNSSVRSSCFTGAEKAGQTVGCFLVGKQEA